ncbi:MAG: TIGR00296 family protein [Thaumarchaeota archaeon]|nr:TIGR00296 family protein [Nitrososphaerota archaeon]
MALTLEEGKQAVVLARNTLEAQVRGSSSPLRNEASGPFTEMRGVFVTLNLIDPLRDRLRGCIGFPYPVKTLQEAIRRATIAAAWEDPRFPPVVEAELDSLVVEVSVLTPPKDLLAPRRQDLPSMVRIGEDGLIIGDGDQSGLLLPQVATEFGLNQVEFLSQACMKAGLPPDSWLKSETRVRVFQAEIFSEANPRGEVHRVNPSES